MGNRSSLLVVVLLLVGACGRGGDDVARTGTVTTTTRAPPTSTIEATTTTSAPSLIEPCPDSADRVVPASLDHGTELLVGAWILCGDEVLLPRTEAGNEVGIEFAADGRFYRVYQDDGALIRAEGIEQHGEWRWFENDEPGRFQLNLTIVGSGTVYTNPEFFGIPTSLMRTPHTGGYAALVPWTGAPPVPGTPAGVDADSCGLPTDPIVLESVAAVEQLLVGTWIRCSADSAIGPVRPGEVGIEIAADGRFYRLYDDTQGGLILATGGDQQGTWAVIEISTEIPIAYEAQVKLRVGPGTFISHATFMQQPRHLRLAAAPTVADYQLWAGAPPVPGDPTSVHEPYVPAYPTAAREPYPTVSVHELSGPAYPTAPD